MGKEMPSSAALASWFDTPPVLRLNHASQRMRSAFIDKLLKRMDRLEPGEVQSVVLELMKEKGFLEKVFQTLQEGVILLGPEGAVTYVNQAACTFFGLQAEQVIGQKLQQGMRGLDWNELLKPGAVVSRDLGGKGHSTALTRDSGK